MNNKLLPLGSIIKVKGSEKEIMITGFYQIQVADSNQEIFDYIGCLWPEGIVDTDQNLFFNNVDIDKVLFKGFVNEEEDVFKEKLEQVASKIKANRVPTAPEEPEVL